MRSTERLGPLEDPRAVERTEKEQAAAAARAHVEAAAAPGLEKLEKRLGSARGWVRRAETKTRDDDALRYTIGYPTDDNAPLAEKKVAYALCALDTLLKEAYPQNLVESVQRSVETAMRTLPPMTTRVAHSSAPAAAQMAARQAADAALGRARSLESQTREVERWLRDAWKRIGDAETRMNREIRHLERAIAERKRVARKVGEQLRANYGAVEPAPAGDSA